MTDAMETLATLVSPVVLAGLLIWNFAVLSAVQLTVRLIGAYSVRATLRAALLLTVAGVPLVAFYLFLTDRTLDRVTLADMRQRDLWLAQAYVFQQRLAWFPVAIALTAVAGFLVIRGTLRFKRVRSAISAAIGIGVLSAPWLVFLYLPV